MTYLKRAMMERPDMDPKSLVLFHCPFDFDLPLTACPTPVCASPSGGSWHGASHASAVTDEGEVQNLNAQYRELYSPPTLCYLCWNREVPE